MYDISTLYDEEGRYIGYPEPDCDISITDVKPLDNLKLEVMFENGVTKIYDVKNMFDRYPEFKSFVMPEIPLLISCDYFKLKFDKYGVYWDNDLDIAEAELWYNSEVKLCTS